MRFPADTRRLTGVVVPVSALRGARSLGVGEFLDLIELADFCERSHIGLIQLLPVNDSGFQSSPYSALSAFALHPLYLRLEEVEGASSFKKDLEAIRKRFDNDSRFTFGKILKAKLDILGKIYEKAAGSVLDQSHPGGSLGAWIDANPWVIEYAVYRRLKEIQGGAHWKEWKSHASIDEAGIKILWDSPKFKKEHLFWVWLQRKLDKQFLQAATALSKRNIVLKGDLPILMNEDSCDVWAHPEYFRRDLAAGAPPDMFSPLGQNWQFPIYDWETLARDDYRWWRDRLALADRYYSAYRIDHVLGFFRIWAASRRDRSAVLGRFIPSQSIDRAELEECGFNPERVRWLSQPHITSQAVVNSLKNTGDKKQATAEKVFNLALDRVKNEELWLFKTTIRGEMDIEELGLHPAASAYLGSAWGDRALLEYEKDHFVPAWAFWDSLSFSTLSDDEKRRFEALANRKKAASEAIWEEQGTRLLSVLSKATPMLACAEDLGAVPDCVPRTLEKLGVLGLRVIRWARRWGEAGEPYIPVESYPELSVCTPSVHDSSTLREWWEREANRNTFRSSFGVPNLADDYGPETARSLLGIAARASSRLCVFQIQDLLHLSPRYYAMDPASERVNVPGSVNNFNWTYRLPVRLGELAKDDDLSAAIATIADSRHSRPLH